MPSLRHLLSDAFDIPKELFMNLPRITLVGNLQMVIENHRGVLEYGHDNVKVALAKGVLGIKGQALTLRNIGPEEIIIDGNLQNIYFEQEESTNV